MRVMSMMVMVNGDGDGDDDDDDDDCDDDKDDDMMNDDLLSANFCNKHLYTAPKILDGRAKPHGPPSKRNVNACFDAGPGRIILPILCLGAENNFHSSARFLAFPKIWFRRASPTM